MTKSLEMVKAILLLIKDQLISLLLLSLTCSYLASSLPSCNWRDVGRLGMFGLRTQEKLG